MVNTRLWSDGWIRSINPLDRYLFIYLLTNEHTTLCGIYELPLSTIAYETGIDENDLTKTMLPRLMPKVHYIDGWLYITNYEKYHQGTEKTQKGIENSKAEVPSHILEKIEKINAPYMPHTSPSGSSAFASASAFTSASALTSALGRKHNTASPTSGDGIVALSEIPPDEKDANGVISMFKAVNPHYQLLYKRKSQRESVKRMVAIHGIEKVLSVCELLQHTNHMPYLSTITTPMKLEEKWADLEAQLRKEKTKLQKNKEPIFF